MNWEILTVKQFMFGLLISVAFIVGSVFSQLVSRVVPSAHAGSETGRWIYRCESLVPQVPTPTPATTKADLTDRLNELGRQGWEMVPLKVEVAGYWGGMFCFRQPLH